MTANFISNPFSPVAGEYNGLFSESNEVRHASAGFFTLTLSSKSTYSGRLFVDGNILSISGKFDLSGETARTVSRSKFGKSTLNLALALDWSTTNETIHGTLSDGVWVSGLSGNRSTFDATFNPTTNFLGRYSALIPQPTNGPTEAPGGYGFLLVTNSSAGVITISQGALGDGTLLSQKVPMSKFGKWPLYIPTYKAITRYTNGITVTTNLSEMRGALFGWVTFTNNPTRNLVGTVDWMKSELSPTNTYYTAGFTNRAGLIASAYYPPATGSRLLNLDYSWVVLDDGNLVSPSTNTIYIQTNNVAVTVTTSDQLKLSFDAKIGLLKGTFAHPHNTNKITSFS
ncbi:MAG TPA: hypothetical protein VM260_22600, partial [Pirellula sp.]|nr:hypothetical protein [Pirellula sp.]